MPILGKRAALRERSLICFGLVRDRAANLVGGKRELAMAGVLRMAT